jgi:hypothetical protein
VLLALDHNAPRLRQSCRQGHSRLCEEASFVKPGSSLLNEARYLSLAVQFNLPVVHVIEGLEAVPVTVPFARVFVVKRPVAFKVLRPIFSVNLNLPPMTFGLTVATHPSVAKCSPPVQGILIPPPENRLNPLTRRPPPVGRTVENLTWSGSPPPKTDGGVAPFHFPTLGVAARAGMAMQASTPATTRSDADNRFPLNELPFSKRNLLLESPGDFSAYTRSGYTASLQ